jgi:hypothetical protein
MALLALGSAPASAQEEVRRGSPAQRIPRIGLEIILGSASGVGMAYGGYLLGCSVYGSSGPGGCATTAGGLGALAGFTLGVPLGVMLGGAMLDGDGGALPTFLGTGLGVAAMIGGSIYLAQFSSPLPAPSIALLALPVVLGVAGYELTSHDSRTAAQAESRGRRASLMVVPTAVRDGFGVAVLYAE